MVTYNITDFYVELYFPSHPGKEITDALKSCGWKWFNKKGCWSIKKNEENIRIARELCEQLNPPKDPFAGLPKKTIFISDIIVRANSFYCNKNHNVKDIVGIISIIDKKGTSRNKKVVLAYCETCDVYYILEETYKNLKKYGVIGCQVMSKKMYEKNGKFDFLVSGEWAEYSPLRLWGYTTSKNEGLTDDQRKAVLAMILDKKLMSKDKMLSYLDFFVRTHNNEDSISCWKEDRKFVEEYKIDKCNSVIINL